MKPGDRYPYQDRLHGAEGGDFYIVRVFKKGFLQKQNKIFARKYCTVFHLLCVEMTFARNFPDAF